MGETTAAEAQLDDYLYLEKRRQMTETVRRLVGEYPLHNDICHRKAASLGKRLLSTVSPEQYRISLLHFTGHTMLVVSDINSGGNVAINTGFPPKELGLSDDYIYYDEGHPNPVIGNKSIKQIQSRFLNSPSEVEEATAWSVEEAKRNVEHYPHG